MKRNNNKQNNEVKHAYPTWKLYVVLDSPGMILDWWKLMSVHLTVCFQLCRIQCSCGQLLSTSWLSSLLINMFMSVCVAEDLEAVTIVSRVAVVVAASRAWNRAMEERSRVATVGHRPCSCTEEVEEATEVAMVAAAVVVVVPQTGGAVARMPATNRMLARECCSVHCADFAHLLNY